MECPICQENITRQTGLTTLSCSHSFHLKCIGTWVLKSETCPCCRSSMTDYEKLSIPPYSGRSRTLSYEDDDEEFTSHIRVQVPLLVIPHGILQGMRLRFSVLDPESPEFIPSWLA